MNFDVGHGAGSFSWQVARAGLEQGLLPATISSDIHAWNIAGPVFDLATTYSLWYRTSVSSAANDFVTLITSPASRAKLAEDGLRAPAVR